MQGWVEKEAQEIELKLLKPEEHKTYFGLQSNEEIEVYKIKEDCFGMYFAQTRLFIGTLEETVNALRALNYTGVFE